MTNLELFYFTGKCLTIAEHPGFREEIIEKIMADSIDWQKFVGLCSNHLILPVIYLKLKSQDILEYLPEEVSEYLKEIYDLNRTRNNQILKQLEEVTGILNKGNIYPVYLKGAGHLLDGLYTDTGERMMGDIDLLVPEKDYLSAANLIEKEGYSADCPAYLDVESQKHYPRLFKASVPADIEIHRLPVSKDFQSWFNPELIFKEKKIVSSLEGCFTPSDKHNIIHNFIHSQLAHEGYLYGKTAFRDLYDLYLLSKRAEVKQTVLDIKTKQKAIAYFAFAGKALGLPEEFYPANNLSSWLFTKKHELNYGSRAFFYTYRTIIYITRRIVIGFTSQIIQSLYSKKMRQSVFRRLSDRQYLHANLDAYKRFFSPNK